MYDYSAASWVGQEMAPIYTISRGTGSWHRKYSTAAQLYKARRYFLTLLSRRYRYLVTALVCTDHSLLETAANILPHTLLLHHIILL